MQVENKHKHKRKQSQISYFISYKVDVRINKRLQNLTGFKLFNSRVKLKKK